MRTLFTNDDLKRMAAGVAVASISGLLMGAALQPELDERDTAGPQILMGDGGPRRAFTGADAGVGAYSGQLPEYVVGTDWTRAQAPPESEPADAEYAGDVMAFAAEDAGVQVVHNPHYVEEPRPAPRYPSMSGNVDNVEAEPPAPPEPPADDIDTTYIVG